MVVFSGILTNPTPGTIRIVSADGTIDGQDDGLGNITGTGINAGTSSIIYNTGELEVETNSPISGTLSAYYNNSSTQWESDAWNHLRISYNGQRIQVSKNGDSLGSVAAAGVLQPLQGSTANNLVALGAFHNPESLFVGLANIKLAEFRISSVDRGLATAVDTPLAITLGSEQALATSASISNNMTGVIRARTSISQGMTGKVATTGSLSYDVAATIIALSDTTDLDVEGVIAVEGNTSQDVAANIASATTILHRVVGTIARIGANSITNDVTSLVVIPGTGVTQDIAAYIQVNAAATVKQEFTGVISLSKSLSQNVTGFIETVISETDLDLDLTGNIAVTASESLDVEANIASVGTVSQDLTGKVAVSDSFRNSVTGYIILASGSFENDLTGVFAVERETVLYCAGQIVSPSYGDEISQNLAGYILVEGNEQSQDIAAVVAAVNTQSQDITAYVQVDGQVSQDVTAYVEAADLQTSLDVTAVITVEATTELDATAFLQISSEIEQDVTAYVEVDGNTASLNVSCYISSGEISIYSDVDGYIQTTVEESLDLTAYIAEGSSTSLDVAGEILRTATVVNLATGFLLSGIIKMSHSVEANIAKTGDVVQNVAGKIGASKTLLSNCTGRIVIGPSAFGSVASRSSGRDRT